uniref:Band 7 domain-containing protein n=1 Tax=Oryza rufipogon TaxID=4529 RepID=A0A0E0PT49_ORYRU
MNPARPKSDLHATPTRPDHAREAVAAAVVIEDERRLNWRIMVRVRGSGERRGGGEVGRFVRLAEPGLHLVNPLAGECVAGALSTRVQSNPSTSVSRPRPRPKLICAIQYRVVKEHADDAFYELQNPQQQIQAYAFDVFGVAAVKLAHNVGKLTPVTAQSLQLASVYKGEAEKILLVKKSEAEAKIPFW